MKSKTQPSQKQKSFKDSSKDKQFLALISVEYYKYFPAKDISQAKEIADTDEFKVDNWYRTMCKPAYDLKVEEVVEKIESPAPKYKIVLTSDQSIDLTEKRFNSIKEAEDHLKMYFWCGTCCNLHVTCPELYKDGSKDRHFGICNDYLIVNVKTDIPAYFLAANGWDKGCKQKASNYTIKNANVKR